MMTDESRTQHDESIETEADGDDVVIPLSEEVAAEIERLQAELAEANEARLRALADFSNFQRRSMDNERRARAEGEIGVVRALLPVLDHFDLALGQEPEQMTVEQLLGGVKLVRSELGKALETRGVSRIEPVEGEPFDPERHEAMLRQSVEGATPNTIVSVLQAGYAMGEQVLRPAKVAVSAETPEEQA